jgi:hypothetical protein
MWEEGCAVTGLKAKALKLMMMMMMMAVFFTAQWFHVLGIYA